MGITCMGIICMGNTCMGMTCMGVPWMGITCMAITCMGMTCMGIMCMGIICTVITHWDYMYGDYRGILGMEASAWAWVWHGNEQLLPRDYFPSKGVGWSVFECFGRNGAFALRRKLKFAQYGPWEHTPKDMPHDTIDVDPSSSSLATRSGPRVGTKKRRRDILVRILKTKHGKGIYHCTSTQDPLVALCCYLTWPEHALQSQTQSCGSQTVLDGLVGAAWREAFARLASSPSGQSIFRF